MSGVLRDKVAIITGAGSGYWKGVCFEICRRRAKLLLPDISLERAEAVAKEIRFKGGDATAMLIDIAEEKATQKMAVKVIQEYGKVDI